MLHFWAVVGRLCLDEAFHRTLFPLTDPNKPYEQLVDLRKFLQVTQKLPLGRWEIEEINRFVAGNYSGMNYVRHSSVDDDHEVAAIRLNQPPRDLRFSAKLNFCSVFGLVCVDQPFRLLVVSFSDPEQLRTEMEQPTLMHPESKITREEAAELLQLIKAKQGQIAVFHGANWIIPEKIACSGGYSLPSNSDMSEDGKSTYMHLSQPGMIALLTEHPSLLGVLLEFRVVKGDVSVLSALFPA